MPKVLMIPACTFNCISMHEDDDEFDSGKVVTRQSLADAFNNRMDGDCFGLEETLNVQREFQIWFPLKEIPPPLKTTVLPKVLQIAIAALLWSRPS